MDANDEYTGCIYADPCASVDKVSWRRDASGRDFPWDLTKTQVASLDLKNLPIRLEHVEKEKSTYNNEARLRIVRIVVFHRTVHLRNAFVQVGRIVDVARDSETQYTAIKFRFHNTPAGHAARALVDNGKVGELSLGHHYYPDTGRVEAREVNFFSLVFER